MSVETPTCLAFRIASRGGIPAATRARIFWKIAR
jgi:hypothetical protein